MYTERRQILTMLKDHKLSVGEAEAMLDAITPKTMVGEVIPPKLEYVGESDKARRLRERMQEAAHTESPVLIYGEAGTGKAHAAKIIHAASRRASHPFVGHDCEVSVENNDAELFGLESIEVGGTIKRGLLEMAQGGALLIASVNLMTPGTQHRLHSYLNDGYFTRMNGVQPVYSNVPSDGGDSSPVGVQQPDGPAHRGRPQRSAGSRN